MRRENLRRKYLKSGDYVVSERAVGAAYKVKTHKLIASINEKTRIVFSGRRKLDHIRQLLQRVLDGLSSSVTIVKDLW